METLATKERLWDVGVRSYSFKNIVAYQVDGIWYKGGGYPKLYDGEDHEFIHFHLIGVPVEFIGIDYQNDYIYLQDGEVDYRRRYWKNKVSEERIHQYLAHAGTRVLARQKCKSMLTNILSRLKFWR